MNSMSLDLIIGDMYTIKELENAGYQLIQFYSQRSIFTDDNNSEHGYLFKHVPLQKLKFRYQYEQPFILPKVDNDIWSQYEKEYEDELMNCCSPLRLGIPLNSLKHKK